MTTPDRNVFAYGSLMFERVWRHVVRANYQAKPAFVLGFTRFAVRGEDYPALVATARGDRVDGTVYLGVSAADIDKLDRFETADYVRLTLPVFLADGSYLLAETYLATPALPLTGETWDAERFAAHHIERFLRSYAPAGETARGPDEA